MHHFPNRLILLMP